MPEAVQRPTDRTSGLRALSKITPPVPTRVTANPRLHARIDALRERPVVWVHGLPGAGKTSLIAGWLGARGIAPLWYRLDDGDGDPASFFAFLGRAAAGTDPEIAALLPRLTPQHALPAFARSFFQALFSHAATPVIVFDDYHEVEPGAPTHALIAAGLAEAPPDVTIVVISRAGPPPDFSRLRANGQLAVIGPEELRLTAEEARAVARERDAAVPAAAIDTMVARTDGWTAGLVLILEARESGIGPIHCPGGTVPEAVFDYFAGEVFRRMDAGTQDQLLSLGQLPAMTAETATELTGSTAAAETLERLVRRSYFTTRDAQERPSYRFHPLFQDFLRSTARATWSAERLEAVRRRAAVVLEDSGQPEAAMSLLAEIGDTAALIAMLLRWAPAFDLEGRAQSLAGWLSRLPSETIASDGWLSYWAGAARMSRRPADSRAHYARARTLFEEAGDPRGLLLSWLAFSESIRFDPFADNSELDASIAELPSLLSLQTSPLPVELEARAASAMYVAMERRWPDHSEREMWRDKALDLLRRHGPPHRYALLGYGVLLYDALAGRHAQAERRLEGLPDLASLRDHPFVQQLAYFAITLMQTEKRIPGDAAVTARAALDDATRSETTYWIQFTLTMAAIDAQNRHDVAASEMWLALNKTNVDQDLLPLSAQYHGVRARHELISGRLDTALRHAEASVEVAVAAGWLYHQAWTRVGLAEIQLILGQLDEAERQLALADELVVRGDQKSIAFGRLLVVAGLVFARGREDEGREALAHALRYGRQVDERGLMRASVVARQLTARALAAGIETDYARRLIRLNRIPCPDPDIAEWPWPLKIVTLGGFSILKDDAPLPFSRKTPRRLIALLKAIVAFGGSDVPEAQVVDALWQEEEGDAAHQSFTVAVHRLRKLLGDPRAVIVTGSRVSLNPELCWLDLWSFERLLDADGSDGQRRERALALYRGDFLAADDDLPWAAPRREQMRRRYVRACAELAETRSAERSWDAALACYRRGIAAAPTAEPLYRGLMACHRARGERAEGIVVFGQLEAALAVESGRRPAPESVALRLELAGEPASDRQPNPTRH